jgi:hypothetical protein
MILMMIMMAEEEGEGKERGEGRSSVRELNGGNRGTGRALQHRPDSLGHISLPPSLPPSLPSQASWISPTRKPRRSWFVGPFPPPHSFPPCLRRPREGEREGGREGGDDGGSGGGSGSPGEGGRAGGRGGGRAGGRTRQGGNRGRRGGKRSKGIMEESKNCLVGFFLNALLPRRSLYIISSIRQRREQAIASCARFDAMRSVSFVFPEAFFE